MSRRMHGVLKQPLYARQFLFLWFYIFLFPQKNFQRMFLAFLLFKICFYRTFLVLQRGKTQTQINFSFFQIPFFILGKSYFLFGVKGKYVAFGFNLWFIIFSFFCFTFSISNFNSCVQQSFQNDRARSFCFEFCVSFCKLVFK